LEEVVVLILHKIVIVEHDSQVVVPVVVMSLDQMVVLKVEMV
jgi:hypothetical protein